MPTYIAKADVDNVFGTVNIAAWSDLTGGKTVNTNRIDAAIDWAERRMENRFRRSRYEVPFVAADGEYDLQLTHWMAVYAGNWLYQSRGIRTGKAEADRTSALMEQVDEEINEVLAGKAVLHAGLVDSSAPGAPFVVTPGMSARRIDDKGSYNL